VRDLRPFSAVSAPGFKAMVSIFDPNFTVPCPKTLLARCESLQAQIQSKISKILEKIDWVSITTDTWTSRALDSYMSVTAHFIDSDWTLQSVTLGLIPCFESHTPKYTAEHLRNCLQAYKIVDKVATDNASNMVAMKALLPGEDVRCAAHTLQLTVKEVFSNKVGIDLQDAI